MSPERTLNENYGKPGDIWGAALILFEMLSCSRVFESQLEVINNPPKPLPSYVPEDIKELLTNLLDKDPSKRMTASQIKEFLSNRKE